MARTVHTRSRRPAAMVDGIERDRTGRDPRRWRHTMPNVRAMAATGAFVLAALVGGTIVNAAAASPSAVAPPASGASGTVEAVAPAVAPGAFCATFRHAFAVNLGVAESALGPAAKAAADTTVDAAVADGKLSKAAGDRIKARIAANDGTGCGRLGHFLHRTKGAPGVARDGATAAAGVLGMTPAELRTQMRGGASLQDIAATRNVPYQTVTDAVKAAVKADLDAAVKAGKLTQARADRILARVTRNLADGGLRHADPAK